MKKTILFVERKPSEAVSIEKVFRQIAKSVSEDSYRCRFEQLRYPNDTLGTIKNLLSFRKKKADIYHITGHIHYMALVLPRRNTVLTVHDAGILHIRIGLRRWILKKLLFDFPIKKLKYITAISEATKREIIFHTKCNPDKIHVIENPLQEHFNTDFKKTFNTKNPTILQIGTTANKNIPNLIRALEGINCHLRVIGNLSIETINLLKEKKVHFSNNSNLNDEQIREEYTKADIVSFCSTFEGFGLPVIEAQAMRTPVITSEISPLKEVAGTGAAFADPNDYKSIRNGISRIIADENYRQELVRNGIANVKKYKPEKIALQYESIYREIIRGSNN